MILGEIEIELSLDGGKLLCTDKRTGKYISLDIPMRNTKRGRDLFRSVLLALCECRIADALDLAQGEEKPR